MNNKINQLTAKEIERVKPDPKKKFHLRDGGGLSLVVKPSGAKSWESRYTKPATKTIGTLGLGSYPDVTLKEAREKAQEIRRLVSEGIDPKFDREKKKIEQQRNNTNTLFFVAAKWFEVKQKTIVKNYADEIWRSFELYIFPYLGKLPISEIAAPHTIDILMPLAKQNKLDTLKRVIQRLNEVMRYAVNTGMIHANPLAAIGAAFDKPTKIHHPCLSPEELPELMRAIATSKTKDVTKYLITWQLHTIARPNEAARAKWSEIDLANKLWVIPAERMKMRREHKIPLTLQTLALLEIIRPISGHREYIFPSDRNPLEHACTETANTALKRMGFKGRVTSHGLRALARTILNKQGFDRDVMEAALSHVEKSEVVRAYNRDDYLEKRIPMMQWWSDHIEQASNCNISLTGHKALKVITVIDG